MRKILLCLSSWLPIIYANTGASGSGTTTQNWNCCKPSCGWPGKANFSAPVRSCDIDNEPLLDANIGTSCENGTIYMCADQAPWLVNPHMAYGFAAVNIIGGTEASWCCACYELLFTSGMANGKKMIVQATDTEFGATNTGSKFVLAVRIDSKELSSHD